MKYMVSYCVMTMGNPFHHACLIFSKSPQENAPIEVENVVGFYGMRTTTPPSVFRSVKIALGLDVDLKGNHGLLKQEELRYLTLGHSLKAKTFVIEEDRYFKLIKHCEKRIQEQTQAITEIKEKLQSQGYNPNSYDIYQEELRLAKREQRPPRLRPFEFGIDGFSLNASRTCKTDVIDILKYMGLADVHIDVLTEKGKYQAIPKYSGPMEDVFFHAQGPLTKHLSTRTGRLHFFNTWVQAKTIWLMPPQNVVAMYQDSYDQFLLPKEQVCKIKSLVSTLQQINNILIDAKVSRVCMPGLRQLQQKVESLYVAFSSHWQDENVLLEKINQADHFICDLRRLLSDATVNLEDLDSSLVIVTTLEPLVQCEIAKLFNLPGSLQNTLPDEACLVLDKLHRLESTLLEASIDPLYAEFPEYLALKNKLIDYINRLYDSFFEHPRLQSDDNAISNVGNTLSRDNEQARQPKRIEFQALGNFFTPPVLIETINLQPSSAEEKVRLVKYFFNNLYLAINDLWDDVEEVETVSRYLERDAQQLICNILERPYCPFDPALQQAL